MANGLLVKGFSREAGIVAKGFASAATGTPGVTPGVVSLSAHSQTTLTLTATDATGGTSPYTYQWQRALSTLGPFINVGTNSRNLADTGLTQNTTYYYRLNYTDTLGSSATSAVLSATTDAGTGSGLPVAVHPDYTVTWEPPGIAYYAGEKRPLKWTVVRNDGSEVDAPSGGTVTVTAPDGTETVLTPDVESSDPAVTTVVAQDYLFATAGYYSAKLLLEIGNQIVGTETPISIDA